MKNKKGFTLLETVIALGILIMGIGGLYIILQDIEFNFSYAKEYITAAYLNQGSIEFVQNIKDTNIGEGKTRGGCSGDECEWDEFLPDVGNPKVFELVFSNDYNSDNDPENDWKVITNLVKINDCFDDYDAKKCYGEDDDPVIIRSLTFDKTNHEYSYKDQSETVESTPYKRIVRITKMDSLDGKPIKVEAMTLFKMKSRFFSHRAVSFIYNTSPSAQYE